ncbi:phosphoserine phosphatase SerB [Amaricoccus tamworthensis]|uniref:phosphoserine phosphatase SerB n=1 Tax=Amaricoccus tamworthensis TaxID=57002 RepID=UPI003C7DB346
MSGQGFVVVTSASGVSDAEAAQVADASNGTEPRRLADSAVDFALSSAPDVEALRTQFQHFDLNWVPERNREKKLLIADMDSTMISVECIDELADFAGVKDEVSRITELAMQGELDFEEAILARVGLLRDLPVASLSDCYAERVKLNPGAWSLVQTMNARGAVTALVSGGFDYFTGRVAEEVGFASHQANVLLERDGRLTGDVGRPILGRAAKLEALGEKLRENGLGFEEVIAVGDGANDLDMITASGLGVAYHAKPALAEAADARLDHSDLTALLALQGIPQSSWITRDH